jgi:hypothetical protein
MNITRALYSQFYNLNIGREAYNKKNPLNYSFYYILLNCILHLTLEANLVAKCTVAEQYQRCFRPNELDFRPNDWLPVTVSVYIRGKSSPNSTHVCPALSPPHLEIFQQEKGLRMDQVP